MMQSKGLVKMNMKMKLVAMFAQRFWTL